MYINNIDDIVDVLNRIESKIKTLEDKVEELEYDNKEAKNYHNNLAIDVNNYKWDNDNRVKEIKDKLKLLKGDKNAK